MTSRTGHVMAAAALHPLDERLRRVQTVVAAATKTDLVDGQSQIMTSSPVTSDSKVISHCFLAVLSMFLYPLYLLIL